MLRDAAVILAILTLLLAATVASLAADAPAAPTAAPTWLTSYDQALKLAKESGKPILARFTGSDWNGLCIKQQTEVFDTAEFKEWAGKNVVLLLVDFPSRKGQDEPTKNQNQELKKKFDVKSYPTILLITSDAKETGRVAGYKPGTGAKKWLETAAAALGKK